MSRAPSPDRDSPAASPPIHAMAVTPFLPDGGIDEAALRAAIERYARAGVGVYLGSYGTGEGHLLREPEIERLYAIGVAAAAGRTPIYAAAIGFSDTDRVIEQAQAALRIGVDAVQIHPPRPGPIAIRPRPNELARFYDDVLGSVAGPVHLTNQVVMSGYALPLELLEDLLARYPQIEALNTSDPNAGASAEVVRRLAPRVPVYVGVISQLVTTLALGGAGALCFEADVAPELCLEVVARFRAGDLDGLRRSFLQLLELNAVLSRFQNPRSVKAAMRIGGLASGALRRPYLELEPAEIDQIATVLDALGLVRGSRGSNAMNERSASDRADR